MSVIVAIFYLGDDDTVDRFIRVCSSEGAYHRETIDLLNRHDDGMMESMTQAMIDEGLEEYTSDPDDLRLGFMTLNRERRSALIRRCLKENKNREIILYTTEVIE